MFLLAGVQHVFLVQDICLQHIYQTNVLYVFMIRAQLLNIGSVYLPNYAQM